MPRDGVDGYRAGVVARYERFYLGDTMVVAIVGNRSTDDEIVGRIGNDDDETD